MAEGNTAEGLGLVIQRWSRALGDWLGHRAIPPMAAALAYRTVFSIIPICVIGLVVLQRFVNKQEVVDDLFGRVMTWLGVSQISVNPDEAMKIDSVLRQLATSFDKLSFTGIGIISGLTLIYAAISLLIELENSFNKLYNAPRGRSLVRRIMQYWLLVSLGPVLLAGSFLVAERVTGVAGSVEEAGWLLKTLGFITSVAISTVALWVLFITVPNARVKLLPALHGAVAGAVALELAKYGFHLYLEKAALKTLYGSLALIPIFLLWVYVTWLVVLTALRVSYLVQHGRRVTLLHIASGARGSAFIDPSYALSVACEVGRAFARGEPSTVEQVADRVGMTDQAARSLLTRLTEDRILLEVQVGANAGRERYVLSRPAEAIAVETVLRAGFAAVGSAVPPQVAAMRGAQLAASTGRTLADELKTASPAPASPPPVLAGEEPPPDTLPPSAEAQPAPAS
ncbi:MAG TPA: YhjD/YihY/BrkB family envelope integrity protein [Phycisphaerales bacterium]|nr:YhjD/YihY/BrkB family envelope integrity protein [Phycisphaerales bacterium]